MLLRGGLSGLLSLAGSVSAPLVVVKSQDQFHISTLEITYPSSFNSLLQDQNGGVLQIDKNASLCINGLQEKLI